MFAKGHHTLISLSVFVMLTASIFLLSSLPKAGADNVVVFVSPYASEQYALEVVAQADGYLMNAGSWPWIVLATSPNPEFVEELYEAGALFVGSGRLFSACFPEAFVATLQPSSPMSSLPVSFWALGSLTGQIMG